MLGEIVVVVVPALRMSWDVGEVALTTQLSWRMYDVDARSHIIWPQWNRWLRRWWREGALFDIIYFKLATLLAFWASNCFHWSITQFTEDFGVKQAWLLSCDVHFDIDSWRLPLDNASMAILLLESLLMIIFQHRHDVLALTRCTHLLKLRKVLLSSHNLKSTELPLLFEKHLWIRKVHVFFRFIFY